MKAFVIVFASLIAIVSAVSGELHQHPEGNIVVRSGNLYYAEPPEQFAKDLPGVAIPEMIPGAEERVYTQGRRHAFMSNGNVIGGGPMPWPEGDFVISKIEELVAKRNKRNDDEMAEQASVQRKIREMRSSMTPKQKIEAVLGISVDELKAEINRK